MNMKTIEEKEDDFILMLDMMDTYGGSFVRSLASLLRKADRGNRGKLLDAFPEFVREYTEMAETAKRTR